MRREGLRYSDVYRNPLCRHRLAPGACLVLAMLLSTGALAEVSADESEFLTLVKSANPYAAIGYTNDSNLFRTPSGKEDDDIYSLEAGIDGDLEFGRQVIRYDANIISNNYSSFDQFDHTAGGARVIWRWAAGDLWDGRLGYAYNRRLRGLENQAIPRKDMLDRNTVFADAQRWLTTDWRGSVGGRWVDLQSSKSPQLEREILSGRFAVEHVTPKNTLGAELNLETSEYDIRGDRDYDEWSAGLYATADLTPKTRIEAQAGYVSRDTDDLPQRDFDEPIGNIDVTWKATPKTQIVASLFREVSNLSDDIAQFALITGGGLKPTWAITPKTRLEAYFEYEEREFQQGSSREDDVELYGVALIWQFFQNGELTVGYEYGERDSTTNIEDYDYEQTYARVRLGL